MCVFVRAPPVNRPHNLFHAISTRPPTKVCSDTRTRCLAVLLYVRLGSVYCLCVSSSVCAYRDATEGEREREKEYHKEEKEEDEGGRGG